MDVARPRDMPAFLASRPKDFESCLKMIKQYGNWLYIAERNNQSELVKAIEDTLFHLRYCYYIYEKEETFEGVYFRIAYERQFPDLKLERISVKKAPAPLLQLDFLEIIDQRYGTNTVQEAPPFNPSSSNGVGTVCASSHSSDLSDSEVLCDVRSCQHDEEDFDSSSDISDSVYEMDPICEDEQFHNSDDLLSERDDLFEEQSFERSVTPPVSESFTSDSSSYSLPQDKHWSDEDSESTESVREDVSKCVPFTFSEYTDGVEFSELPVLVKHSPKCEPQIVQCVQYDGQTVDVVPLCCDRVSLDPIGRGSILLRSMCSSNFTFGKDFVSIVRSGRSVKRNDLRSLCVPALAKDIVQLAGGW